MGEPLWVVCEGSGAPIADDEVCPRCKAWASWARPSLNAGFLVWEPHYRQDSRAMALRGDFNEVADRG